MRLAELQVALKRYGFDDSDPLTTWLNAALHQFEDSFTWPFLESTTTIIVRANEDEPVTLPTDFRKIISLRNITTKEKLVYWPTRRFEANIEKQEETGNPEVYTVLRLERLRVWQLPTVDTTFTMNYVAALPDIVSPEEEPRIPTQYHFALVRGAAYIALQAENEEERAQTAETAWQADLARAMMFFSTHEEDEAESVNDSQGYAE